MTSKSDWIKAYTDLPDHPKIMKLMDNLNIDNIHEAVGLIVMMFFMTCKYSWRNGDLKEYTNEAIARGLRWTKTDASILVKALQEAHFLDGYKVHNWRKYASKLIYERLYNEQRRNIRQTSVEHLSNIRRTSVKHPANIQQTSARVEERRVDGEGERDLRKEKELTPPRRGGVPPTPPLEEATHQPIETDILEVIKKTDLPDWHPPPTTQNNDKKKESPQAQESPGDLSDKPTESDDQSVSSTQKSESESNDSPEIKKKKKLTDVQRVTIGFKLKSGNPQDDTAWDKVYFARFSKSAKDLLTFLDGDVYSCLDCIDDVVDWLLSKNLAWTPETIVKHAADWRNKKLEANRAESNR